MIPIVTKHGGYRRTFTFGYVCLVYHATQVFCERNFTYRNDSLGKTVGQMMGAARSARQNIVEGSARAGTSKETELRLYDVAKGSLEELAGDFEAFLTGRSVVPWAASDPAAIRLKALKLEPYVGDLGENARHDYVQYLLVMRRRFGDFLEAEDPDVAANSILVAIDRACALLSRQISAVGEEFRGAGGFSERLSAARLEQRDVQIASEDAPKCPECGKPMRKMIAKKGRNAGNAFWSCTGYPDCKGTRSFAG
ncbi:MAG: four helix bundle suffix domain-containing protein [Kiritimatiellae bacterium]|nr:four helix bundle suffix domain-containing protein [Kiritimatiellia bacterium]